jgi:hypothetical protein
MSRVSTENQVQAAKAGAIQPLVAALKTHVAHAGAAEQVAAALHNIALVPGTRVP